MDLVEIMIKNGGKWGKNTLYYSTKFYNNALYRLLLSLQYSENILSRHLRGEANEKALKLWL